MITVTNPDDDDAIYSLDCDTDITLADLKALLEADVSSASESCIPANDSCLLANVFTLVALSVFDPSIKTSALLQCGPARR